MTPIAQMNANFSINKMKKSAFIRSIRVIRVQ